jgi:putative endonuclease
MDKIWYVYILASQRNGTLYIGVTSNLFQRMEQHKNKVADGFTKKYNIKTLVYYEIFENFPEALIREKYLKWITRKRKLEMIKKFNPQWKDFTLFL